MSRRKIDSGVPIPEPYSIPVDAERLLDRTQTRLQIAREGARRRARMHRRLLLIEERAKALGLVTDHE